MHIHYESSQEISVGVRATRQAIRLYGTPHEVLEAAKVLCSGFVFGCKKAISVAVNQGEDEEVA